MSNKKSIIKQCVGITSATVLMTMAVSVGTGHGASQKPSQITSSQQLDNQNEIRQITRIIKIDDPYKGMQTVKQTVTFKRIANNWQPQAPSIWPSFFTPNYDDFEPSILQVQAQPVSADDSDQTISVTYHQYKITDRERLVEARPSFYGYDENFKFTGKVLNTTTLKVGQWYDVPPAPKGFEYCFPELVPKRLKLYQSRQEPFKLVIRPLQKLNEQPGGKKDDQEATNNEQLITQPEEKKLVTTGSQTDNHEISTSDTQTEEVNVEQQESQTNEVQKNDHATQTELVDEKQPNQSRIEEKVDPVSQVALMGDDHRPNHAKHESKNNANKVAKETQTEAVLRPNSESQKEQETQTTEAKPETDNQQVAESTQHDVQTPRNQQSDNEETSMRDADIQKILDQDSASLRELGSSKNKDKRQKTSLPQTGNQTDNRTTFVGLVITGLVTIITMLFWKQRRKE